MVTTRGETHGTFYSDSNENAGDVSVSEERRKGDPKL